MEELEFRYFEVDVTPPLGDVLCGGYHERSTGVETPLLMQGLILTSPLQTVALAAIDFCYLSGVSYQRLVNAVAQGARTGAENVSIHANHVHDAPLIDEEPHRIVEQHDGAIRLHNETWFANLLETVKSSVARAKAQPGRRLLGASFVDHPVERFASTRRVLDDQMRCQIRWSRCADQEVRNAPEGKIDPMLSQIALLGERNRLLAILNFYASHPQVSDGRRLISNDTVGIARERLQQRYPNVPCLYFTGCAGDVTAGKYSTQDRERNRFEFGTRLGDAMVAAATRIEPHPIGKLRWFTQTIDLPIARIFQTREQIEQTLVSHVASAKEKYQAAQQILRSERSSMTYPFTLSKISFGWFDLLLLPSELVIEYQLFAKAIALGKLAVAAYADSYLMYVSTDEMFEQGGYEVRPEWSASVPGNEARIKSAIRQILKEYRIR